MEMECRKELILSVLIPLQKRAATRSCIPIETGVLATSTQTRTWIKMQLKNRNACNITTTKASKLKYSYIFSYLIYFSFSFPPDFYVHIFHFSSLTTFYYPFSPFNICKVDPQKVTVSTKTLKLTCKFEVETDVCLIKNLPRNNPRFDFRKF
jgi:hypothetical protein